MTSLKTKKILSNKISTNDYFDKIYTERNKMNKSFGIYWSNFGKSLTLQQKLELYNLNTIYIGRFFTIKNNFYTTHLISGFKSMIFKLKNLRNNIWISDDEINTLEELVRKNLRVKGIIYKFYHLLNNKITRKPINNCTLHLEDISTLKETDLIHIPSDNKKKYFIFSLEVIGNIISSALLQANPNHKIKSKPTKPVNPYTRKPFTRKDLLSIYTRLRKYGKHIPLAFEMFMKSGMNLRKFKLINKEFLDEHSSLQYVKELEIDTVMELATEYATDYNNRIFLRRYFPKNNFKYCISCLKNLVKTDRDSVTEIVRDYIYYMNNKISVDKWDKAEDKFQRNHPHINSKNIIYKHTYCNYSTNVCDSCGAVSRPPGTTPFSVNEEPNTLEESVTDEFDDEFEDIVEGEEDEFSDTPQIVLDTIDNYESRADILASETGISHTDALITVISGSVNPRIVSEENRASFRRLMDRTRGGIFTSTATSLLPQEPYYHYSNHIGSNIRERNIDIVISQTGVTRAQAGRALDDNSGSILNAIMEIIRQRALSHGRHPSLE